MLVIRRGRRRGLARAWRRAASRAPPVLIERAETRLVGPGSEETQVAVRRRDLRYVRDVVGRPARHPDLMKPNMHTIAIALQVAHSEASETVLIGDSVSDVLAAHAAGTRVIGFARNPRRGQEVEDAGAHALTTTIGALLP